MEHVEISAYLKLLAEKNQRNSASNFGEKIDYINFARLLNLNF